MKSFSFLIFQITIPKKTQKVILSLLEQQPINAVAHIFVVILTGFVIQCMTMFYTKLCQAGLVAQKICVKLFFVTFTCHTHKTLVILFLIILLFHRSPSPRRRRSRQVYKDTTFEKPSVVDRGKPSQNISISLSKTSDLASVQLECIT